MSAPIKAQSGLITGFDYGTSNCALGSINHGVITPIQLQASSRYLPSLVHAETRDIVIEFVAKHLNDSALQNYQSERQPQLRNAAHYRQEQGICADETLIHFGSAAMQTYIDAPEDGFFAKSPKSFLGATGLSDQHLNFFEEIV